MIPKNRAKIYTIHRGSQSPANSREKVTDTDTLKRLPFLTTKSRRFEWSSLGKRRWHRANHQWHMNLQLTQTFAILLLVRSLSKLSPKRQEGQRQNYTNCNREGAARRRKILTCRKESSKQLQRGGVRAIAGGMSFLEALGAPSSSKPTRHDYDQ